MRQLEQLLSPQGMVTSEGAHNTIQSLDTALQRIFSSPQEETRIQKVRRIMGASVAALADEELEVYTTEFQYLIDEWFDIYERQAFDGATLKQLLGQS